MNIIRSCVYFLFDGDELVYIGKTTNLYYRIGQHVADGYKKFDRFEVFETDDQDRLEEFLIRLLKPKYNKVVPGGNYGDVGNIKNERVVLHYHDGKLLDAIPLSEYKKEMKLG